MSAKAKGMRRGNPLLDIVLNVAIPAIILMQLSDEDRLGPLYGLLLALAFPVGYGLYEFVVKRGLNFYSALGFVSVLLTGGIGLLKLPVEWLAIKEAAIPFIVGVVVLVSLKTRYPLIKTFVHQLIAVDRVYAALRQRGRVAAYERRLVIVTYLVAFSLLISTVLNYVLARIIVVSEPGSTAFNEELGRMTALSYPVIALPSMIILFGTLFYLANGIIKETGLGIQDIFENPREDG